MSFARLKNNRPDLQELAAKANASPSGTTNSKDDRFWYPQRDKAGNGYAVVRFLPGLEEQGKSYWAKYWDHAFKGPTGQWYIEKSLTTIGQQDAIAEANSLLWNSGIESDKDIVRKRKRNLRYVTNVLIISDPANPENEGQIKLYRFGKKIMDKILDTMTPKYPDEKPMDPFDVWDGGDFVIKIKMIDKYPNYDSSVFKSPSPLFDGDEAKLEAVFDKQHVLDEWVNPENFKTYDELKARLNLVLGEKAPRTVKDTVSLDMTEEPAPIKTLEPVQMQTAEVASSDDEDDIMAHFKSLANED